jgi:hypothetical protein
MNNDDILQILNSMPDNEDKQNILNTLKKYKNVPPKFILRNNQKTDIETPETYRRLLEGYKRDVKLKVAPSLIHGVGVFALCDIPKGTHLLKTTNDIIRYHFIPDGVLYGSTLPKYVIDEIWKYSDCEVEDGINGMWVHENWSVFPMSAFLNHSEEPNLAMVNSNDVHTAFTTLRDIQQGEELFFDYTEVERKPKER